MAVKRTWLSRPSSTSRTRRPGESAVRGSCWRGTRSSWRSPPRRRPSPAAVLRLREHDREPRISPNTRSTTRSADHHRGQGSQQGSVTDGASTSWVTALPASRCTRERPGSRTNKVETNSNRASRHGRMVSNGRGSAAAVWGDGAGALGVGRTAYVIGTRGDRAETGRGSGSEASDVAAWNRRFRGQGTIPGARTTRKPP